MASYAVPGDTMQPFHPQPVPSLNHKQRGQKHSRKGKNRQNNNFTSNTDGPPKSSQQQSCFNCGSLEHWAQQCPEPRREFPAGSTKPGRPPKRQKTTGSHNPYFAGEQHYNHPHKPPQRGYTHPPVAHPGYQPLPMANSPYGPPTLISHPHSAGPWPHDASPPHFNSPHSYGLPTPMRGYGPQFPSPSSPMPPHQGYFPPQYSPQYGEPEYHRKSFDRHQQNLPHGGNNRQSRKKWRRSDNVPTISPPIEPWMEELQSLDIPDSSTSQGEIVWRPANQVARPLPSTFDERDDVGMLPPFASLPPGMSVSKYILDKGPEEFVANIRNTEDWPFMMSDPIFLEISIDCELIPIEELIARRKLIFETHRIEQPPSDGAAKDDTTEASDYKEAIQCDEAREEDEYPEREVSIPNSNEGHQDGTVRGRQSSECSPSPACTPEASYRDDTPSPSSQRADNTESFEENVFPGAGEYPTSPMSTTDYGHHNSRDPQNSKQIHSIKPGKGRSNDKRRNQRSQWDRRQQMEGPNRKAVQQEGRRNPPSDRRGGRGGHLNSQDRRMPKQPQFKGTPKPKAKKGLNNRGHPPNHGNSVARNHKNRDNKFGLDGNADRDHTNNPYEHQRSEVHSKVEQIKLQKPHGAHDQFGTEQNSRKRSRQEESLTKPEEPRRQEDDITPKIKRRQPHVAEAYRYGIRQ
ncbi:hypothetical protein AJ78_06193 [Emergomyces pasteurianus Ep9510]|uniref:CCHC-type domain-containing protein n=1 Tax=Emergomyces pasteurianus Ep9510 TaxID=1447872 RepID=A0A1J9P9T8_9EURO|nr:hypothetical protein AJ78_06193 [Emergomyces pasteurianus Ep9510]